MTSLAFEHLADRLAGEMHEGNMHGALRDIGRLAGGLLAGGSLTAPDLYALGQQAESLAINRKEAAIKWDEAVSYGKNEPVDWKTVPRRADKVLDWNDEIGSPYQVVNPDWIEPVKVPEPTEWNPVREATDYLNALFSSEEVIGYCVDAGEKIDEKTGDKKYFPASRGVFSTTAGDLIKGLARYGNLSDVFGDTTPEAGAWVRINPLDGKGVTNSNVTEFRYALVESDTVSIEQQRAVYEQLELPIAVLVHSGRRSLHAIVRIDADSFSEYKKRVSLLYEVCEKNGLKVDRQNSNPARLSRLPGVMRGEAKQYIVAKSIGKASWAEWEDWIEAVNDDLPEPEALSARWDSLPDLSPPIIDGVLRQGHKMLVSGSSKAGKSFLLIELCIAIAEGLRWVAWNCTQGRVLYVNLELDEASCLHRFKDVYNAWGEAPDNIANIDIWNLRGKAIPLDKLAPKLIRRAKAKKYSAVVIDPIYKVITGDENAADKMAFFCNQFDRICHELEAAVIYCHHHSKGAQGGKRSMDRASGSGVFARDPDALIDLIELAIPSAMRTEMERFAICRLLAKRLDSDASGWREFASEDDMKSESKMMEIARAGLKDYEKTVGREIFPERERVGRKSAWRLEGTFREFAPCSPVNCWFDYPVHAIDPKDGILTDADPAGEESFHRKGTEAAKHSAKKKAKKNSEDVLATFQSLVKDGGEVTVSQMAGSLGVGKNTARAWIESAPGFVIEKGAVQYSASEAARLKAAGLSSNKEEAF